MTAFARRSRARVLAAAFAAVAVFSLSACQEDEVTDGSGRAPAPNDSAPAEPGPEGGAEDGADGGADADADAGAGQDMVGDGSGTEESGAEGEAAPEDDAEEEAQEDGSGEDVAEYAACTAAVTELTLSEVSRPINHLLLTATNTGDTTCYAYDAPYLGTEDAQSPARFIDESRPQSVLALAPGESAYASVITSGVGENGYTAYDMTVGFSDGGESGGSAGDQVNVPLPGGEVYLDSDFAVSYWLPTAADALIW